MVNTGGSWTIVELDSEPHDCRHGFVEASVRARQRDGNVTASQHPICTGEEGGHALSRKAGGVAEMQNDHLLPR